MAKLMTLDEAIKHCEEVAEEEEKQAIWLRSREGNPNYKNCVKRAKEQRQLAEWLKKLKAYESDDEICKYCTHTHDADYCNMCKHNTIFVDYFDLEVNTDADSD